MKTLIEAPWLADLATELPANVRLQRLIGGLRAHFCCGAVALLRLEEDHLCPVVVDGLVSEALGLVPRGQGGHWAAEGRTGMQGDIVINPSGGLLAKGHPVGATGVGQIVEVVLQLRGEHANQVAGATTGMTHNLGGTGVACTVHILGREA